MKIRRYLGSNTQEAILKVKMDLGNDALILNTKKVRKKGLFGIFQKPVIEVLAAIDEYAVTKRESIQEKSEPEQITGFRSKNTQDGAVFELETKVKNMESLLNNIFNKMQTQLNKEPANQSPEQPNTSIQPTITEQPAVKAQPTITEQSFLQTLHVTEMPSSTVQTSKQLQHTQATVKFQQNNASDPYQHSHASTQQPLTTVQSFLGNPYNLIFNNLVKNEVEPEIAKVILDIAKEKIGSSIGINDFAAAAGSILAEIAGKPRTITVVDRKTPVVVMFVGPTGVGKTTTLAKIAADFSLNQGKRVGLITADTYRIAAVEQLKTYAEILGIPISVVYSPTEIKAAVCSYTDKELILIDTAGRSSRNKAQFEELKSLVNACPADEIFLVLSATTSSRNTKEILNQYGFIKDFNLLFTKTDETSIYGQILNARYISGKPLSYVTYGQSVPDDIEVADAEKLIKSLIGSIS